MKHLRVVLGLALIPLSVWIGSLVHLGTGSGILIGVVLGITLSFLFLVYGPGRTKSHLPTSYYLNHDHQLNSGANLQAAEHLATGAREEDRSPLIYQQYPPPDYRR